MKSLKINSQSLPARCEVCHQVDCFDAANNYCQRCGELNSSYLVMRMPARKDSSIKIREIFRAFIATSLLILLPIILLMLMPTLTTALFGNIDDGDIFHSFNSTFSKALGQIQAVIIALISFYAYRIFISRLKPESCAIYLWPAVGIAAGLAFGMFTPLKIMCGNTTAIEIVTATSFQLLWYAVLGFIIGLITACSFRVKPLSS